MAGVDINRSSAGVNLPPAVSAQIWQTTQEASAAMSLATQQPLPGAGVNVPIITGDPVADWVDETDEKPVSRPSFGNKMMTAYTLAVIVPFSNQYRRDLGGLYQACVRRLPGALSKKFDQTVFGGGAPGSNFDTLDGAAAVAIGGTDVYSDLVTVDGAVATGGGELNGWAISPTMRGVLLNSVDGNGRPLFINDANNASNVGSLLGQPVYRSKGVFVESGSNTATAGSAPDTIGFAGDWSSATYGTVEGVSIAISDQATLTDGANTINLWQRNMFAVRAEIEVGFRVRDIAHFARLTNTAA